MDGPVIRGSEAVMMAEIEDQVCKEEERDQEQCEVFIALARVAPLGPRLNADAVVGQYAT